ncbi:hypothetical protein EDD21DRAFT_412298 [Dissophora ornata]|nr:hypothetical protein EDD21DRAFT_412298 [Dissophora ornata]
MRVAQSPANGTFIEWLLCIGEGTEPTASSGTTTNYVKILNEYLFQPLDPIRANNSPAKQLIREMYPDIETTGIQANLFAASIISRCGLPPAELQLKVGQSIMLLLKPAFAVTINKLQGQTLDTVGLYLPKPVFGHGHLYVALSRCTDLSRLKSPILDSELQHHEGVYTRNVVYKNVLT